MEVGIACQVRQLPSKPRPLEKLYAEAIETAKLAEELGFAHFWVTEGHFAPDSWISSPLILLAAIANCTKRIRLGTYVTTIGLHNPIRFAEDAATVDLLSNGRLDLGFGGAIAKPAARSLNIDATGAFDRAYEAAEIVEKCFCEEEFSHKGKYYDFPNVRMTTKPFQKPRPPFYWASLGPKSLIRAAERNYGLASAMLTPAWKSYLDRQAELGRKRSTDFRVLSGPLFAHLGATRDKAWDEVEEGLHWLVEFEASAGMPMQVPPLAELRKPENAKMYGTPMAVGTPAEVLDIIDAYRQEPIDELVFSFLHPGQDITTAKRSMYAFATDVLPQIERW
jgi:alkanesulfonate monooxygenase SsuD/methylene tetrahydromethanopterin reductase-like flavin-dependent oxidoreductase (luciferase family)